MRYTENARRLAECDTYDETFELVKRAAENELGLHRAGLTLVLGDLTNIVGAYHELGSNAIVMNRNLLKIVWRLTKSKKMRNSYVFMILLHEYLHSLGYKKQSPVIDPVYAVWNFPLSVIGKEGRVCRPVYEEVLDEVLVQLVDMMPANVRPFEFQESPPRMAVQSLRTLRIFRPICAFWSFEFPTWLNSGFGLGVERWWPRPFNQPVQLMPSLE
ncbi:MAG: hypothetical protein HYW93_07410 [Thaumarchaeota archaeon]|nr:hypothetical protein [Nitrososphaerota archaeon]